MPLPKQLPVDLTSDRDSPQILSNRYVLGVKLGAGNFGTAYLVYDLEEKEKDNKKVLKQICVGKLDPGESVNAMHEAQLLSRLHHKGIVQFHESFLDGQFFCIITEFCDGGDLDVVLRKHRKKDTTIEENQVVKWMKQLLRALEYMHDKRILHRDLKTKNIFLKENKMKIGDFGISKILMGTSDMASTFVGTPYYMSPEVLKHENYDEKCDMWSLGCVLYEVCCLKHAFEGQSLMAVMYKIVTGDIPELPKFYSRALNIVLSKMLARVPRDRQTAKKILQHSIFQGSKFNSSGSKEKANLTPKERLRRNKQKVADEKYRKHQELAAQNYRENERRHKESLTRNFHHTSIEEVNTEESPPRSQSAKARLNRNNNAIPSSVKRSVSMHIDDVFSEDADTLVPGVDGDYLKKNSPDLKSKTYHPSPVFEGKQINPSNSPQGGEHELQNSGHDATLEGTSVDIPFDGESTADLAASLVKDGYIPEDALLAETYYSIQEDFEVDSDLDFESDYDPDLPDEHVHLSDTEYKEMLGLMEDALVLDQSTTTNMKKKKVTKENGKNHLNEIPKEPVSSSTLTNNIMDSQIEKMRKSCLEAMGQEVFNKAYSYLRNIWSNHLIPAAPDYTMAMHKLQDIVHDDKKCFLLEQLVYLENEKATQRY